MKKWLIGLTSSVLSTVAVVSAYSFGYADFRGAANDIIDWISQIFGPFLAVILGVDQFDQYLFARVLLAILLFMVIYSVIKKVKVFNDHETIATVVAIIISLLGTRTLTESQFVVGILLPYSTLAIALSVALPILIYFYFVHESGMGAAGRKLMWVLFGVIFVSLWVSRLEETTGVMNWVYGLGIAVTVGFFIFDKNIHYYFEYGKYNQTTEAIEAAALRKVLKAIKETYDTFGANPSSYPTAVKKDYDNLIKERKHLEKLLAIK